ncbi:hypothetical protein [Sphingosinicella sp. BN140058]|uniref:hypothetical protein n=1 Tax=Sphingosinicella sp. BN140058 TaxID=1892855 RepID=UPI0010113D33|nr:hypothetical protein [Sphingosinicella sp. BN140058]QAY78931.1 hypothetical protein ETR14_22110 [Sphingosinicella sp. BN140058]
MTYLFGFMTNAVIATILSGVIAAVAAWLPIKAPEAGPQESVPRAARAAKVFAVSWLLIMLYGCVQMFGTHHEELSKFEGAGVVPGLIETEAQVLHAEHIALGDSAQTYVAISTTSQAVERIMGMKGLKPSQFDGHTVKARGWPVPEWWPMSACEGGATYGGDPFADPPVYSEYTLNWCPVEKKAYVQRFDH